MKILYILDYIPLGSRTFDDFLARLVDAVHARGWDLRFVFAGEPGPGFVKTLHDNQVAWCVMRFPLRWRFWSGLAGKWPGYRPDLVYTSFLSVFSVPLIAARVLGWMQFWIVSDESSGAATTGSWVKSVVRKWRGRWVGHIVDKVRTVSHYIAKRDIEQMYLPANKVQVIWNGILLARYPFREQKIDHPELRILFIGQIIAEKGVFVLLEALEILQKQGVYCTCRYAGEGVARGELEVQVERCGLAKSVEVLGFCSDPLGQYHWADVVVVPSLWAEAFGLVAIEAMATGAVVVVSDAGGLPEVVGDAGVIVPSGDGNALAAAISEIARDIDGARDRARRARERVIHVFQVDQTVDAIIKVFVHVSCRGKDDA